MIDARDQISPSAPAARRRSGRVVAPTASKRSASKKSLRIERVFSDAKVSPFDQIEWDKRTAEITDDAGKVIFKQENVEVPKSWSVLATKVAQQSNVTKMLPHSCKSFSRGQNNAAWWASQKKQGYPMLRPRSFMAKPCSPCKRPSRNLGLCERRTGC